MVSTNRLGDHPSIRGFRFLVRELLPYEDTMSSKLEDGGCKGLFVVDPQQVRFTQRDIADRFSEPHEHIVLHEALRQMNKKCLKPSDFPPIEVWEDDDGVMWSYDNRRLWLFRKANGVNYVRARSVRNGTRFRFRINKYRETLIQPDFMPRIRDGSNGNGSMRLAESSSSIDSNVGNESVAEAGAESSVPGLLLSASAALVMGFASWRLYNRTKSDKNDK